MYRSMVGTLLLCLAILVISTGQLSCYGQSQQPQTTAQPSTIGTLEDLKFKSVDGRPFDSSKLQGNVVLISFGATWCRTCAEEMAALEQIKNEFQDKPVKFLWVSIENEKEASDKHISDYAKTYKLTVPVLRDGDKLVYNQFTSRVRLPLIAFFNKEGKFDDPVHAGMSVGQPEVYKNRMRERLNLLLSK
jgi:cytochrome oxidase Cu insertion factor (SCO1/SenC/PrrC family)